MVIQCFRFLLCLYLIDYIFSLSQHSLSSPLFALKYTFNYIKILLSLSIKSIFSAIVNILTSSEKEIICILFIYYMHFFHILVDVLPSLIHFTFLLYAYNFHNLMQLIHIIYISLNLLFHIPSPLYLICT